VTRGVLGLFAVLVVAGCIVPGDPAKQAEEIHSIAAEGALLAHDASEGDTTSPFTRVHAEALRKNLAKLEPKVSHAALHSLLEQTDAALSELTDAPGDERRAARLEQWLERIAKLAEELES
jgi:hypothetical protein